MDVLSLDSLDEFSPEFYVAILSEVAHADGLDAEEQALLAQYASRFEVDLNTLPDVPAELSDVPLSTRILVYRDACMLASTDGSVSRPRRRTLRIWRTEWRCRWGSSSPSGRGSATMGTSWNGSTTC